MTPVMMINGTAVPLGGEALSAGEGIRIEDGTVQVTTPVKGLTQAEYDRLPERERGGLCVITDAATVLPEGGEVYSTEETRIGTWIDGKPLYKMAIPYRIATSDVITNMSVDNIDVSSIDQIISQTGPCTVSDGTKLSIGTYWVTLHIDAGRLLFHQNYTRSGFFEYNGYVVLQYTKITGQGVSE